MATDRNITLGISVGTRYIGTALTIDGTLIDWQVHHFKARWSDKKFEKIMSMIEKEMKTYYANRIVVKVPPEMKISDGTALIIQAIEDLSAKENIPLITTTIEELKLMTFSKNKMDLMGYAVSKYPDVDSVLRGRIITQRLYYMPAIEAIVVSEIIN